MSLPPTDIVEVDSEQHLLPVSEAGQLAGVLEVLPAALLHVKLDQKLAQLR